MNIAYTKGHKTKETNYAKLLQNTKLKNTNFAAYTKCQDKFYQRQSFSTFENQYASKATLEKDITKFKCRLCNRAYPENLIESTLSKVQFSKGILALQNK